MTKVSCKKNLEKQTFNSGTTLHPIKLSGLCIYPVRYSILEKEFNYNDFFEPGIITHKFVNNSDFFKSGYSLMMGEQCAIPKSINPPGMPSITGREYVLSPLRSGWVYLFNNNKKKWYEYEVLETQQFKKCQWSSPVTDIRPANDVVYDYLELNKTDVFYIAYSDVQWSQKYCAQLEASEDERKKKMQMIDVPKVLDGGKVDHIIDPADADMVLNTSTLTFATGFTTLSRLPTNTLYFGCNDPIGIADQLALEIANLFEKIEALVQSVQTGIDPTIVRKCLKEGNDPALLQKKKTLEQTMALHKMALTLYQVGFGTPENIKKFGSELDKARIEKLLAVRERKELRIKLSKIQEQLTAFLKTDYYQKSLGAYRENTKERKLIGKMRITSHLPWIAVHANAKDKLLDIPEKGIAEAQQKSMVFLSEVLEEKNELGKVISENNPVKFDNVGLEHAIVQTWDNILSSFTDLANSKKSYITILVRRLNSIKIEGFSEPFFEELDMLSFHKRMKLLGNPKIYPLPDSETLQRFEKIGDKVVEVKQVSLSEKVVQACQPNHGMYGIADKLTSSVKWNKFVAGVAYVNLTMSMKECLKVEKKFDAESLRTFLNFAAAAADVLEAHTTLMKLRMVASGATENALKPVEALGMRLTVAGYFLGAAVSTIDSGINFHEGDWDAATAYGVAAVLGVITGVGVINLWNPIGLITLFAATLGAGILACLLEDPPLERYVKNCILRSGLSNKIFDAPYENSLDLVKNNTATVKYGFKKWECLVQALRDLMDIIYGYTVDTKFEYEYQYDALKDSKGWTDHVGDFIREGISGKNTQVKKINSNITFRMFLENTSHLEYEIRLYPEGLKNNKYFNTIIKETGDKLLYKNEKGLFSTTLNVTVPENVFVTLQGYGDIVFLTRLHYNEKLIFPEDQGTTKRYMAVRNSTLWNTGSAIGSGESSIGISTQLLSTLTLMNLFGDKIRIGSIDEVLKEQFWSNNG